MINWKKVKKYLVGGAVRDKIMGIEAQDKDYLVVGETIESMESMGFQRVGKNTTAPVFIHPEDQEKNEYSIPRKEVSTGPGYNDFTYSTENVTIEDDLKRRDLTINAIAYDEETDTYIDPFGGKTCIENKFIYPVDTDTFQEDPVRVLRAARFAARYCFNLSFGFPPLVKSMIKKGLLDSLTSERILLELKKALTYRRKDYKPSDFFRCLIELGCLHVCFPLLDKMRAVPQPAEHHAEGDVFEHTMLAIDRVYDYALTFNFPEEKLFYVMMSVLYHDIGKIETPSEEWPKHHGHSNRGIGLLKEVKEELKLSNKVYNFMEFAAKEHMYFHNLQEMSASSLKKLLDRMKVMHTYEFLELFFMVGWADENGRQPIDFVRTLKCINNIKMLCNIAWEYRQVKFKPDVPNPLDRLTQDRVAAVKRGLNGDDKMLYICYGNKAGFIEIENVGQGSH